MSKFCLDFAHSRMCNRSTGDMYQYISYKPQLAYGSYFHNQSWLKYLCVGFRLNGHDVDKIFTPHLFDLILWWSGINVNETYLLNSCTKITITSNCKKYLQSLSPSERKLEIFLVSWFNFRKNPYVTYKKVHTQKHMFFLMVLPRQGIYDFINLLSGKKKRRKENIAWSSPSTSACYWSMLFEISGGNSITTNSYA